MPFKDIFKSKRFFQAFLNRIEFPILYLENNYVIEINSVAKKLLHFDIHKDFEINFDQFCKTHSYTLFSLIENKDQGLNSHEEIYLFNNKKYVINWKVVDFTDVSNYLKGYLIFGIDLSNERLAIENLRKMEFFYNNILSKLPTNVYWKDKNCVYMGCNDRLAKIMGLSSREAIRGMTDFDFDWGVEGAAESFVEFDKKIMRTKQSLTTEDVFKEANGNLVTVLTNKTPLEDEQGNVVGLLAISVDITDKKKTELDLIKAKEQAELANRVKSEFITNMSHDIRTPLSGILGMGKILIKETKSETGKEAAINLIKSADILLDLLNQIIDFSRIESGNLPITDVKFNVKEIIENIGLLLAPSAKEKNLDLKINYDKKIPKQVIGDRIRIHRILLNLASNAIKFTQEGTVQISAKLAKKRNKDLVLKLTVQDTGMGIPLDRQQVIFSRFGKLAPSYERNYKGYGLGLSIVKQFISDIEGEVYVSSELGKGSLFTCLIPLRESLLQENNELKISYEEEIEGVTNVKDNFVDLKPDSSNIISTQDSKKKFFKILLVEDHPIARFAAKHQLEELNCEVDVAENGENAIKLIKQNRYDLIFMDIGLPDKSGIEVTSEVRDWEKNNNCHTPIVALTAHIDSENEKECLNVGMEQVLTKPLDEKKANEVLEKFIKEKEPGNEKLNESYKIIDLDLSNQEFDLDKENTMKILKIFVDTLPETLLKLNQEYQQSAWNILRFEVHKLHGAAAYCSIPRIKIAALNLEKILPEGSCDKIRNAYVSLLEEIKKLQIEFKKYDHFS